MLILVRTTQTTLTNKGEAQRGLALVPDEEGGMKIFGMIENAESEERLPPGVYAAETGYCPQGKEALRVECAFGVRYVRAAFYADELGDDVAIGRSTECGVIDPEAALRAVWGGGFKPRKRVELRVVEATLADQHAMLLAAGAPGPRPTELVEIAPRRQEIEDFERLLAEARAAEVRSVEVAV